MVDLSLSGQKHIKDVGDLLNTYGDFSMQQDIFKNGHILHKFIDLKKNYNLTAEFVKGMIHDVDVNHFKLNLRKLFLLFRKKKKDPTLNWTDILNLLKGPFNVPHKKVFINNEETKVNDFTSEVQKTKVVQIEEETKFKNDCINCQILRETNIKMDLKHRQTICDLKKEISKLKAENREILKKYAPKKIKQTLKRKISKITELKSQMKSFKKTASTTLKHECNMLNKVGIENAKLKRKVKQLESEALELKDEFHNLQTILNDDLKESEIQTKSCKIYEFPMRKVLYKCIVNHVPVSAAGDVIRYAITSLTGKQITHIPKISTIAQMSVELGVLADIQAAEFLLSKKNATLSWDATTLKGSHVNQIHISNMGTSLTLSLKKLSGGKAIDYADHTCQVMDTIATTYAQLNNVPITDIKQKFFSNISNTLTDRAPVNHCVVEKLNEAFSSNLTEMNCNLHPLDSLATVARQTLSNIDRMHSVGTSTSTDTYRNEGRAALCIYNISKLRYVLKNI